MKKSTNFPEIKGRIPFEGASSAKFWVRVFGLEEAVTFAQAKLSEKAASQLASLPIINEFIVNEQLQFYFIIQLQIDVLGIQDGIGVIYYTDKANAEKVSLARDKMADLMLAKLYAHAQKSKGFTLETYLMPPTKEEE